MSNSRSRPIARRQCLHLLAGSAMAATSPTLAVGLAANQIRAVSYNIHHGEGFDRKIDIDRIAAVIKARQPTHVALQEVDQRVNRSGKVAQAEKLAASLGMHVVFAKAIDTGGGEYGTAVMSEAKPLDTKSIVLPADGGEARAVALVATPLAGGGRLWFGSIHVDHQSAARRRKQIDTLLAALPPTDPILLFGDFNAPAEEAARLLARPWTRFTKSGNPATFPADAPVNEIDHAFLRLPAAAKWAAVEHMVIDEPVASDHRPVFLIVRPTAG